MSSPDRASSKRASAGTKPAKPAVVAKQATPAAKKALKPVAKAPSSQDKADFVKAMSKGITPNTAASRQVQAKKTGAKAAAAPASKVEVLRRIPAPEKVVDTPDSAQALQMAAMIEKALADGKLDTVQPHAQQALVAALCKLYAANADMGHRYPVLGQRSHVTATDVMVMCGALLKAVDLQVFELGMWQSWSNG